MNTSSAAPSKAAPSPANSSSASLPQSKKPKPIKPRVLGWKPMHQGNLLGFVDVQIGPLKIRKLRLVQQPGMRAYVSPPTETTTGVDGKTRYIALLNFPAEWKQPLHEAVMAAVEQNPDGFREVLDTQSAFGAEVREKAGLTENGGAR